jgi:hypothetical protein
MGFMIDQKTGDLMEATPDGLRVLTPNALPRPLQDALVRNRANLSENFNSLQRFQLLV